MLKNGKNRNINVSSKELSLMWTSFDNDGARYQTH